MAYSLLGNIFINQTELMEFIMQFERRNLIDARHHQLHHQQSKKHWFENEEIFLYQKESLDPDSKEKIISFDSMVFLVTVSIVAYILSMIVYNYLYKFKFYSVLFHNEHKQIDSSFDLDRSSRNTSESIELSSLKVFD
ncbi:hypothetical protein SSS_09985 [Sarcoptes scabiei]|nr:hypothetical protein SSS_09985 [Sarcoptes scabiei]